MSLALDLENLFKFKTYEEVVAQFLSSGKSCIGHDIEYVTLLEVYSNLLQNFIRNGDESSILKALQVFGHASTPLPYTDDWPQWVDLCAICVAGICKLKKSLPNDQIFSDVLGKIPIGAKYARTHGGLNYNLACYFAKNDRDSMLEFIRRARFYYEADAFINDADFQAFQNDKDFLNAIHNDDYLCSTWWNRVWPIEEWYNPGLS